MSNTLYLDPSSLKQTLFALSELPRAVQNKHVRIAINAAGGVIKDAAKENVPVDSGLLKRALVVKAKVPQASYNEKHRHRAPYAVVGAKRRFAQVVGTKRRVQITKKNAGELSKKYGANARLKVASRYIHLANRQSNFLTDAVNSKGLESLTKMGEKLKQGINQEATKLATTNKLLNRG